MLLQYNFSNISNIEMQLLSPLLIHSLVIFTFLLSPALPINIKKHFFQQQVPSNGPVIQPNRRKISTYTDQLLVPSLPIGLALNSLPQQRKDSPIFQLNSVSSNSKSNTFYKYYQQKGGNLNLQLIRLLTYQLSDASPLYQDQQRNAVTKNQQPQKSKEGGSYSQKKVYLPQQDKEQQQDNSLLSDTIFSKKISSSPESSKSESRQLFPTKDPKSDENQTKSDTTVVKYEVADSVSNIFIASNGNSFSNTGSPQQIRSMYNDVLRNIQSKITNQMFRDSSTKISLSTLTNNFTNKKLLSANQTKVQPVIVKSLNFQIKSLNEQQKIAQKVIIKEDAPEDDQIVEPNTLFNVDSSQLKKPGFISMPFIQYKIRYSSPTLISTQSREYRQKIYYKNIQFMNKFNKNSFREYNMGLNAFTDLQQKEFIKIYAKLKVPEGLIPQKENPKSTKPLPKIKIDWKCYTLPTEAQGSCKSYIQPALQAIYMTKKIFKQAVVSLSLQQILSCGKDDERNNCEGGFYSGAFQYVKKKGVGPNIIYPEDKKIRTKEQTISPCNYSLVNDKEYNVFKIFIKQSKRIAYGDCEQLTQILKSRPVTASIKTQYLQFYKEGVFVSRNKQINHGVLIVGYDSKLGFLIKNSWGVNWGMQGFAYLHQSTGICNYAIYPLLLHQGGEPKQCN